MMFKFFFVWCAFVVCELIDNYITNRIEIIDNIFFYNYLVFVILLINFILTKFMFKQR